MPLIRDDEFSAELRKSQDQILVGWDTSRFVSLIGLALTLLLILLIETDPNRMIAEIIAVGLLVIVYKIDKGVKDLFIANMQCAFILEWVGRKNLGEYENPPN